MIKKENLIEIYEIPYSTTIEAILDKVAELIKAGKVKEIADMRDETDLSRPEAGHRPEAGRGPGQADGQAVPADTPAGHRQPATSTSSSPACPAVLGVGRNSGGVDRLAHRLRASGGCTSS